MMPLFERLKEMVFRNTNRARRKDFFSGATREEQEHLKKITKPTNLTRANKNEIKEVTK